MGAREMVEGIDREGDDAKGKPVKRATPLKHVIGT